MRDVRVGDILSYGACNKRYYAVIKKVEDDCYYGDYCSTMERAIESTCEECDWGCMEKKDWDKYSLRIEKGKRSLRI